MSDPHPPKVETFDTSAGINIDPKGFHRAVERWGGDATGDNPTLYMARTADHPRFGYLESWLLPALDLRVNRFHFRNGTGHGPYPGQDLYIDIAVVDPPTSAGPSTWRTTDLYIDVVTYADGRWEVLDLEELGDALTAGHLDPATTSRALAAAQQVCTGLVTSGSVDAWLRDRGFPLSWAAPDEVVPAPPGDV
ncbi:DUF402 domain-containing protein [Corynebacterium terpenotabidum]|uniref:DUF402 domain-containing protein n=1 Tax=Corynebacterium terpenotabidum Y-11 TaxID=1200352 RepID=S4XDF1_9CORY|nr:DUF402 domain-containing protein [Corynebacterium terpenotabidum]AGP31177.1 hypothetical protein A606_07650 [Corynebacterium terpenotabidum Y-11]